MMTTKSVEEISEAIERYRLMSSKDIATMRGRWFKPDRKEVANTEQFRRWLVANRYLTEFVAKVLSGRKSDQLVLNDYRLQDQMISGPMAGAYLAIDPLDRHVAIEVLSARSTADKTVLSGFQQAAVKSMKVRHPNVGRILDMGEAYGLHYLVKEYFEGQTLEDILARREKLPYLQATRLFALALAGVEALHKEGVPAGDLAVDCLLLAPAGKDANQRTVKILHAGVRRQLFDETAIGRSISMVQGIPDELELATSCTFQVGEAGTANPPEDIFRLGCLFYRAVTGKAPYPEKELPRPSHSAQPIREIAPEVPEMLCEVIEQMIDPEPSRRQQSAAHVAKALRVFLAAEEHVRETREEEKIVAPTEQHRAKAEEEEPADEDESDEDAADEEEAPRRKGGARKAAASDGGDDGIMGKFTALWEEIGPTPRELVFFGGGSLGLLLVIFVLSFLTGIRITYLAGLATGAAASYFVERYVNWRDQRKEARGAANST
jgi:serine/threonine protein kinase